ncbi:UbiH/UbiF/VisC/COQ6 family ubiquinone biosynthesis hydroxylase [Alphaproteobacteria bacterium]|nr:UbiH/UbiF/VisC/COQ6 family ubiquinone biosynthesis hydroxylase [Alphaproteobacteria bacterium]
MTRKQNDTHFDVLIVGGGLAGLSLSCLLGKTGMRVGCIDAQDPKTQMKADERTTAISYGSQKILDDAGIWNHIGKNICPIEDIEILDGNSPTLLEFLSRDIGREAFGWITDNRDLRAAMAKQIKSLKNVQHIAPAKVQDFEITDEQASVILEEGKILTAQLIVGADGRNSFTREWMDVPTRQWSYNQRAMVCIAGHENPHGNVAVEHFWPEGPFAILPMCDDNKGNHRSSIVFTEHGPERDSLTKLSDQDFTLALAARFPERYGNIKLMSKRFAYPLGLVHAADYIKPRMALIADAAHGIHPIAGQGLNLGFRDIKALASLVSKAHESGEDLGNQDLLQTYQRKRRIDNMAMVAATDGLNRLFSNNMKSLGFLRKIGLKAVAKIPPAKRFFMKQAMGDA